MENSMNSMRKPISSNQRTSESPEESGWTVYFEDLSVKNSNEHSYCSSGFETSSLVSDAASLAGKRSDRSERGGGLSMVKSRKRSSFKKRKTAGALVEDALEDTASSPINSLKVCNMYEMDMDAERNDNTNISQEKVSTSGQILDERSEARFIGRANDCTELKKRGLCLVPLSTTMNYFG